MEINTVNPSLKEASQRNEDLLTYKRLRRQMHSRTEKCNALYVFRFLILYPYQLLLSNRIIWNVKGKKSWGNRGKKYFLKDSVLFLLKRKLWVCFDTCGFSSRFGFGAAGGVTVRLSVCFSSVSTCGLIVWKKAVFLSFSDKNDFFYFDY